jgi:hypothetical protein
MDSSSSRCSPSGLQPTFDLATAIDPYTELRELEEVVSARGYRVKRNLPDAEDDLGGLLRIWTEEDEHGDPVQPVEVVNFLNPHRPRRAPARDAITRATPIEGSTLRCVTLADLVAIKLDAGSRADLADVVAVLRSNPDADVETIRATCKQYGFEVIDELIAEAQAHPRR